VVGTIPLVIPVWWLAKRPLLQFDLNDEAVSRLLSSVDGIAGIVGKVLDVLQTEANPGVEPWLDLKTLVAIAASSLGTWDQMN